MMWRIALVALIVVGAYYALPRFAPGAPSSSEADSFGKPWTVDSLVAAVRGDGVSLRMTDVQGMFDGSIAGVREPMLLAEGTIGVLPAHLLVYSTVDARMRIWQEEPGRPEAFVRGAAGIPEIYQFGVGNAVVVLLGFNYSQSDYDAVRSEVLALRNR